MRAFIICHFGVSYNCMQVEFKKCTYASSSFMLPRRTRHIHHAKKIRCQVQSVLMCLVQKREHACTYIAAVQRRLCNRNLVRRSSASMKRPNTCNGGHMVWISCLRDHAACSAAETYTAHAQRSRPRRSRQCISLTEGPPPWPLELLYSN